VSQITDKEAAHIMTKARIALIMEQPFWGTLALRLNLIEDRTLKPPTMATNGRYIKYHPDFVHDHSFSEVKFVIGHEVGHCVFDHITRANGRQPKRWNKAGDYVINPILIDSGMQMPKQGLLNPAFAGMSADEIYELLPPEDGSGGGGGDDPLDSIEEPDPNDPGSDTETLAEDWKIATVQAANAARGAGKLPASLQRFVDEMIQSKADWRQRLRNFFLAESRNDYSWARVNRRYASLGIYLPGLHSQSLGTVVIVTDDSGSIGDDILQAFAGEIDDIRQSGQPERTVVISCDAEINHVDDLTMDDTFKMECHGGGGTDFRPPFKWLEQQGIEPACLVYLTDLYGPFPSNPPPYPVLWCSINDQKAPWGETLRIEI
jgi:predicted metal-dependent peptidase